MGTKAGNLNQMGVATTATPICIVKIVGGMNWWGSYSLISNSGMQDIEKVICEF
jgi:hypothetical protein